MLGAMDVLEGATVLDLFAGSGAMGIECLSRGAESAVMVDDAPEAIAAIRQNVAVLGSDERRVKVVRSDALSYLSAAPPFDLVLADPPYGYLNWAELMHRLCGRAGLLVAETGTEKDGSPWSPGEAWETVRVKRYGSTVVSIVRPMSEPTPMSEPAPMIESTPMNEPTPMIDQTPQGNS